MARSDTRYSIYPAPKAVEIVGNSAPALNQAVECWAALLVRAMADNAKKFWNGNATSQTGQFEDAYAIKEWNILADALRGMRFDPEFANPCELLATAVEDAHRLENVGGRWFTMDLPPERYSEIELSDKRVSELVKNLRDLDYAHAWAMILAVQWFWEHHGEIDAKNDAWWTLAFRRQWHQKATGKKSLPRRRKRER